MDWSDPFSSATRGATRVTSEPQVHETIGSADVFVQACIEILSLEHVKAVGEVSHCDQGRRIGLRL